MSLRDLIIDLDSYFASVEQQLHPRLRGKPIAIIPVNTNATCCIAASKEAKKFGVKTGTGVLEARAKCPGIEFVESTPGAYVQMHHEFITAVESCLPVESALSIDEVWCPLQGKLQLKEEVEKLARQIKSTIAHRIGPYVTCSMGIAPNRFLAKLASDMGKPNGLTVIEKQDLPECLHGLELRDFCGIGKNMELRLRQAGICTVKQLTSASRATLHQVWGSINGVHMWHWLRGEVTVPPPTKHTVIGHSHVLPPELRSEKGVHAVCQRLLQKAAMRLRKMEHFTKGLQMFIKYQDHGTWSENISFTETQDTYVLLEAFARLWKRHPDNLWLIPMATGVTLCPIIPQEKVTQNLLTMSPRQDRLCSAVDAINKRGGQNKVVFGGALGALDYTPMRIAFTRIPDPETEK
jgi:DNA polymerase IV